MSEEDYRSGGAGSGDDSNFCELAGAFGLARDDARFVGVRLVIGGIVGRDETLYGYDGLLRENFVRFFFGDDVRFGAGGDLKIAGDRSDADSAGRVDGDLAGCGRVALGRDSNVGCDDFNAVDAVAAKGERAAGEVGDGAFWRGVEAAVAIGGEAIAGICDSNVGGAADFSGDFFAGENAGAFCKRTLANVREVSLEHDAEWRVLRG